MGARTGVGMKECSFLKKTLVWAAPGNVAFVAGFFSSHEGILCAVSPSSVTDVQISS